MCNSAFHKLLNGFEATYTWNDKFKEYVDANFNHTINMYGQPYFTTEDMKSARKFWKMNQKKHPNYPWFNNYGEAYDWVDNMPFGGYEY